MYGHFFATFSYQLEVHEAKHAQPTKGIVGDVDRMGNRFRTFSMSRKSVHMVDPKVGLEKYAYDIQHCPSWLVCHDSPFDKM